MKKKLFNVVPMDLLIVILVAIILRFTFLGSVPSGIANDEVSYILSGYTIAKTGGTDIAGNFLPLSVNLDSSMSPVPVYILSFFTGLLGVSTLIARLPFAILGVGTIVVAYFICIELFKNRGIAFWASLIFAFSSWHIVVTRTVWDVIPAQFFYLLGLLIFLNKVKKGGILWSLPFFFLGFFSYHGTKVFFAAFILILIAIYFKYLKSRIRESVLFGTGLLLIFLSFAFVTLTQSVTRQHEIIFTNKEVMKDAAKKIEFERGKSSAPEILKKIESNKGTYFIEKMLTNYLGAFSANHLFLTGDIHPLVGYGIFFKGVLYLIDLPLLIAGFAYLFAKVQFGKNMKNGIAISNSYREGFALIVGGLLVSPLPSTIGAGSSYFIRSFMMSPFLSITIGIGCYALMEIFSRDIKLKRIVMASFIVIYCLFVSRFLYQYFYQLNTYGSEYWNKSSKELSEYIISTKSRFDKVIVTASEDKVFLQYALASKADPVELRRAWKKDWPVYLGRVEFANSCLTDTQFKLLPQKTLYVTREECHVGIEPQKKIVDPLEPLRVIWKLYER